MKSHKKHEYAQCEIGVGGPNHDKTHLLIFTLNLRLRVAGGVDRCLRQPFVLKVRDQKSVSPAGLSQPNRTSHPVPAINESTASLSDAESDSCCSLSHARHLRWYTNVPCEYG